MLTFLFEYTNWSFGSDFPYNFIAYREIPPSIPKLTAMMVHEEIRRELARLSPRGCWPFWDVIAHPIHEHKEANTIKAVLRGAAVPGAIRTSFPTKLNTNVKSKTRIASFATHQIIGCMNAQNSHEITKRTTARKNETANSLDLEELPIELMELNLLDSKKQHTKWTLKSSASSHMTGEKNDLQFFEAPTSKVIKIAGGQKLPITGNSVVNLGFDV